MSPRPAARDFDGLYKALLDSHPREALTLLCGARLDGREVILEGPTEQPRQRSRQADKVFLVPNGDGVPADVYHVEIQVKRTEDFQERMVSYWASLALKYRRADHRIHQIVLWPQGGGYPGHFRRDHARLDYHAVNVPDAWIPTRYWPARWPRWPCGPASLRRIWWTASPNGSPKSITTRKSWYRSIWVCSWEVRWRPSWKKRCGGEA